MTQHDIRPALVDRAAVIELLRAVATARREYARTLDYRSSQMSGDLFREAATFEAAARVVDGDVDQLRRLFPSWVLDHAPAFAALVGDRTRLVVSGGA